MSAPLAADVQTSPAQVHGCKGTTKNAHAQILSGKSFGSFKSFNGNICTCHRKSVLLQEKINSYGR